MDYSKFSDDTLKKISAGQEIDYAKLSDDELKEISSAGASAEPTTPAVETGPWEATARATEQGVLMGFGDELHGALGAGLDKLTGSDSDLIDLYRKNRDESRAEFKAGEEAHPYLSTAGNLAGGLVSGLATGGTSMGLKGAIGLGALAGAGSSEADLTQLDAQQAKKLATDVGVGGALGGAVGVAANKIGSSLSKAGKNILGAGKSLVKAPADLGIVQGLAESAKQGAKGRLLVGIPAEKALKKEAGALIKSLDKDLAGEAAEAMAQQKALIASKDSVSIGDYVDDARKALRKAQEFFGTVQNAKDEEVAKDIAKLGGRLDAWVKGTATGSGEDLLMTPTQALQLKRIMGRFGSSAESNGIITGEGQNIANRLIRNPHAPTVGTPYTASIAEDAMQMSPASLGISDVLDQQVPGLNVIDDRVHSLIEAKKVLPNTATALSSEKPGVSGISAQESVDKFLEMLPKDVREKMGPKISDMANAVKTREKIAMKTLADKGVLGSLDVGLKGAFYGTANIVGYGANSIWKMSGPQAQELAKKAAQGAGAAYKGTAVMLERIANTEGASRNALIYSMQQNPEYRAVLEKLTGVNPVVETNEK